MGSVLSVAQRLSKSFIQTIVRVINLQSPQLHITGNVNFGTNHGTLNQQHFFQSWLDATKPPAAVALDGLGIQSAPSEMETFCHVPAQVAAALRPEGGSPKQTSGQDGHSFVHPNGNNSDDTQSRKFVDDVPCGSPGDRRPALPAPEVSSIQTAEHPEPPSEAQGSPSAESADGKSASNWVVPATEIVHADVLDVKKGKSETEQVTVRVGGAGRRDMASPPKKSGIFSAIASVGLGKPKTHPISTGKEEDTLLVDNLEAELKEIEAFAKHFAKDAVEWARLTTRSINALRTWLVSLWKSISDTESESEAFEAFSDLVEKGLIPLCVDLEAVLNDRLLKGIAHMLKTMNQPYKLLASMHEQEPVHYQYISTPSKFKRNKAYFAMQSTSASYVGLRALLLKDLPKYICLLHRSMAILVKYLADIQKRFWKDMSDKWGELWGMLRVDGEINAGFEETINVWAARWTDVDEVVSSLNVCRESKIYQEPERARRRTASGVSDVSASPPGASAWVSSPMAFARAGRSRSRNSQELSQRLRRGTSSHSRERWPETQRGRPPTPPAGLYSPPRSPTPAMQGKLSPQMPSAPNGKPLRSSRKSKSHKSTSSDKPRPRIPVSEYNIPSGDADQWALKPAKYVCRVIHFFNPPAETKTPYLGFPFFLLHVGALYDVLHEAGHPNGHSKLPLFVEGEDCLLLCRNMRGEVGWALASFLEPIGDS